jgi:hypothetical protein
MSSKNGDKSRYHRMRKQKLARRLKSRELQQKSAFAAVPSVVPLNPKPATE